jgi:multidrug efflux pump subunit AcrB
MSSNPSVVEREISQARHVLLSSIAGIRRTFSHTYKGRGLVWAELEPGSANRTVLDEIKEEVGKIDSFPEEAKEPWYVELARHQQVINIAVFGNQSERVLKEMGTRIRDDLLATPVIL